MLAPSTPLEVRFARFHRENPHILRRLEERALELHRQGEKRIGMAELYEHLRRQHISTSGEPFRLNNSFRSYYSRFLIFRNLELDGVIETRPLKNHLKKERAVA